MRGVAVRQVGVLNETVLVVTVHDTHGTAGDEGETAQANHAISPNNNTNQYVVWLRLPLSFQTFSTSASVKTSSSCSWALAKDTLRGTTPALPVGAALRSGVEGGVDSVDVKSSELRTVSNWVAEESVVVVVVVVVVVGFFKLAAILATTSSASSSTFLASRFFSVCWFICFQGSHSVNPLGKSLTRSCSKGFFSFIGSSVGATRAGAGGATTQVDMIKGIG